jgi:hypothetical protein
LKKLRKEGERKETRIRMTTRMKKIILNSQQINLKIKNLKIPRENILSRQNKRVMRILIMIYKNLTNK